MIANGPIRPTTTSTMILTERPPGRNRWERPGGAAGGVAALTGAGAVRGREASAYPA